MGTVNANLPLRAAFLERVAAQLPGLKQARGKHRAGCGELEVFFGELDFIGAEQAGVVSLRDKAACPGAVGRRTRHAGL